MEVVQILIDLDLIITKAYISSDGGWFMDGLYMNLFLVVIYLDYELSLDLAMLDAENELLIPDP